ncbi:MAG TPA: hypothetical protein VMU95_09625 [Trebonia sp.]|nr:hypothetical protein [Trebonia sp.]
MLDHDGQVVQVGLKFGVPGHVRVQLPGQPAVRGKVNPGQPGPLLAGVGGGEPPARLGNRVAEHDRADQPLEPGHLSVWHARVQQGLVDAVHQEHRLRRHRGPGEEQGHDGRVPLGGLPSRASRVTEPLSPVDGRTQGRQLTE